MSDEWARRIHDRLGRIYDRLNWMLLWLFIIALNTCAVSR